LILADAGPLIALFDSDDAAHLRCADTLAAIRDSVITTVAVLTEAFHILGPSSASSSLLRDFVASGSLQVWFFDRPAVVRAFELMDKYADRPMDFADASLVTAAEALDTRTVFTLDKHFAVYRVRRGHRHEPFEIIP